MKIYSTKSGAQNVATRLNKIESINKTIKFWEVETIIIDKQIKYIVQAWSIGEPEIYGA